MDGHRAEAVGGAHARVSGQEKLVTLSRAEDRGAKGLWAQNEDSRVDPSPPYPPPCSGRQYCSFAHDGAFSSRVNGRRNSTTCGCSLCVAQPSGVALYEESCAFGSAPSSTSSFTISRFPIHAALCSGVTARKVPTFWCFVVDVISNPSSAIRRTPSRRFDSTARWSSSQRPCLPSCSRSLG